MVKRKQPGDPTLGERATHLMEERGMNVAELSARSGIEASYLRRILNGDVVNPTLEFVLRLARGLDVPLSDLFGDQAEDAGRRMPPAASAANSAVAAGDRQDACSVAPEAEAGTQPAVPPALPFGGLLNYPDPKRIEVESLIQELRNYLLAAEEPEEHWRETLDLLWSYLSWLKFRSERQREFPTDR